MKNLFSKAWRQLGIFTLAIGVAVSTIAPTKLFADDPEYVLAFGDSGAGGLIFAVDSYKDLLPFLLNITSKYKVKFVVSHIGDTQNAPYGQREPEDIKRLTKNFVGYMVNDAHADVAVIACNTASTIVDEQVQAEFDEAYPDSIVMPIIKKSAETVYKKAKVVTEEDGTQALYIGVLATPATVRSGQYQKSLKRIHEEKLGQDGVVLHTFFYGPKTWVKNVEFGATATENTQIVQEDLAEFLKTPGTEKISTIGLFCTHYPFFKEDITSYLNSRGVSNVPLISQGKIFADRIRAKIETDIDAGKIELRNEPLDIKTVAHPKIYSNITGENLAEIKGVMQKIAPDLVDEVTFSKVTIQQL